MPKMSDLGSGNAGPTVQDMLNKKKQKSTAKDEDEWGDEELGDDLLPM